MTVLDADFLIALERDRKGANELVDRLLTTRDPLRVPAAAWLEYMAGVNLGRRAAALASLESACAFHAFGPAEATVALATHDRLVALGRPLAGYDLQIAATALTVGEPLVTNDQAFRHVPGLDVMRF